MKRARPVVLPRIARGIAALVLSLAMPQLLWAQAALENPQPGSFQSGIGVVSGFVCDAEQIEIEFDGTASFEAAYGTSRGGHPDSLWGCR